MFDAIKCLLLLVSHLNRDEGTHVCEDGERYFN